MYLAMELFILGDRSF